MPTATLTTATLETIGRPKQSKFEGKPDYRPCLFKLSDGEQFWKSYNVDAPELTWLKKGDVYQVAISGDDHTIIQPTQDGAPAPASAPQPAAAPGGMTPEQKRQIASYVESLLPLYSFCYAQAQQGMKDGSEVAIASGAAALFEQACRRFGL